MRAPDLQRPRLELRRVRISRRRHRSARELDGFEHERFDRVLDRVTATIANRDLIIDATDLDFVDHHALLTIREHAHDRAGSATILSRRSSGLCRLVEILDLGPDVVVETVA